MSPVSFCQTRLKKHPRSAHMYCFFYMLFWDQPYLSEALNYYETFCITDRRSDRNARQLPEGSWLDLFFSSGLRSAAFCLTGSRIGVDFSLFHGSCGEVTVAQFLKPTDGAVGPVLHRKKGNVWTENGIKKREREAERKDECDNMAISLWKVDCDMCSSSTITLCWY